MLDPIHKPVSPEDSVYADAGGPPISAATTKKQRIEDIERQQQQEQSDLMAVLSSDAGQRMFMRIMDYCHPYEQIHMAEHAQAALLEGRRRVGLHLINLVQRVDPEMYPAMLLAHMKRKRALIDADERSAAAKPHPTL